MRTVLWLGMVGMIAVGLAGCAVYDVPGPDPYAGPYAYAPYDGPYGGGIYPDEPYDYAFGPSIYPSFGIWGGYGGHRGWHHGDWHHGGGGHFGGGHHGRH